MPGRAYACGFISLDHLDRVRPEEKKKKTHNSNCASGSEKMDGITQHRSYTIHHATSDRHPQLRGGHRYNRHHPIVSL